MNHVTSSCRTCRSQWTSTRVLGLPILTKQEPGSTSAPARAFSASTPPASATTGSINHVCFGMENFDADAMVKQLAERGVKANIRLRGDTKELYFTDPDGIRVQLQDVKYIGGTGPLGDKPSRVGASGTNPRTFCVKICGADALFGWAGVKLMRRVLLAATLGGVILIRRPRPHRPHGDAPTFSKDVAPIFQAKCQACHQPNSIAPMSLITYQEARPWARSIKERVVARPDAALAHRPERRRAEVQERHVAQRRADRHDRPLGRRRRAAGRPEGPAAAQAARHRQRVAGRARRLRPARPRHQVVRVHDAGAAPGRLVPPDERHPDHRAALGEDGRDSSDQPEGAARSCTTRSPTWC